MAIIKKVIIKLAEFRQEKAETLCQMDKKYNVNTKETHRIASKICC